MKIKFSKLCVCWAILVPTFYDFFVVFMGASPPDAVTYCIHGLSLGELISLALIKRTETRTLLDSVGSLINGENVEKIAEAKLGVDLERTKK